MARPRSPEIAAELLARVERMADLKNWGLSFHDRTDRAALRWVLQSRAKLLDALKQLEEACPSMRARAAIADAEGIEILKKVKGSQ